MRLLKFALLTLLAVAGLSAQSWDTSGNNLLQGTYYFRQVVWIVGDNNGNLSRAIGIYGNIVFDGNGKYALSNAQINDSNASSVQNITGSGTYTISASGLGFLSPLLSGAGSVYGSVSRGIFTGSSTEAGYNDLFIAAEVTAPQPTNAFFKGPYTMMSMDFPTGSVYDVRDSQFQLNPDGNGNLSAINATGLIASSGSRVITQSIASAKYFFSNGAANMALGGTLTATNLIAGTKYLYFSKDGDFVFGGSPTSWDMIVGVRSGSTVPDFKGLYYQAGVSQDNSGLASAYAELFTHYGSLKSGGGVLLGHQRLLSAFNDKAYEYTYSDTYALKPDNSYDDVTNHYVFSPSGAVRIGLGRSFALGVNVAVLAPSFTPTGVFIDPTGILNAASSALFTAGISPGELISIYGSNLATAPVVDSLFPFELGGVKVMVNDRPAPIYSVSSGQISAVIPFGTTEGIAGIQVIKDGDLSNRVTSFVNQTAPGIFTQPPGGIGTAAALHSDYTLITADKPALIGEAISLYVTGLGSMSPAVPDGAPGPISPLSLATHTITVLIGGVKATTTFVGLAPQLVGLNQVNVIVPIGVAIGNAPILISGPDFYSGGAVLPVGAARP